MSIYTHATWDQNRGIYFQLGLIIALTTINIIINSEFRFTEIGIDAYNLGNTSIPFHEVRSHKDVSSVQKQYTVKPNPLNTKIVLLPKLISMPMITELPKSLISTAPESNNISTTDTPSEKIEQPALPVAPDNKVFVIAESMPYLKLCDHITSNDERKTCTTKYLLDYIQNNLKYPNAARAQGIQGTVIVSFIIDISGNMIDINITKDIGGGCGQAAIKSLSGLSNWVPGRNNNQAVNVKYTIPIKFRLD